MSARSCKNSHTNKHNSVDTRFLHSFENEASLTSKFNKTGNEPNIENSCPRISEMPNVLSRLPINIKKLKITCTTMLNKLNEWKLSKMPINTDKHPSPERLFTAADELAEVVSYCCRELPALSTTQTFMRDLNKQNMTSNLNSISTFRSYLKTNQTSPRYSIFQLGQKTFISLLINFHVAVDYLRDYIEQASQCASTAILNGSRDQFDLCFGIRYIFGKPASILVDDLKLQLPKIAKYAIQARAVINLLIQTYQKITIFMPISAFNFCSNEQAMIFFTFSDY